MKDQHGDTELHYIDNYRYWFEKPDKSWVGLDFIEAKTWEKGQLEYLTNYTWDELDSSQDQFVLAIGSPENDKMTIVLNRDQASALYEMCNDALKAGAINQNGNKT